MLALDITAAMRIGPLLGTTEASDVVDGHVAHLAVPGDRLLTSDPEDVGCWMIEPITCQW